MCVLPTKTGKDGAGVRGRTKMRRLQRTERSEGARRIWRNKNREELCFRFKKVFGKMYVRCWWERRGAKKLTVFSWLSFLLYCYIIHSICTVSLPPEISSVLHPHLLLPPRSSIINKLCSKYPPSPRQQCCVWQSLLFFFFLSTFWLSLNSVNKPGLVYVALVDETSKVF